MGLSLMKVDFRGLLCRSCLQNDRWDGSVMLLNVRRRQQGPPTGCRRRLLGPPYSEVDYK